MEAKYGQREKRQNKQNQYRKYNIEKSIWPSNFRHIRIKRNIGFIYVHRYYKKENIRRLQRLGHLIIIDDTR